MVERLCKRDSVSKSSSAFFYHWLVYLSTNQYIIRYISLPICWFSYIFVPGGKDICNNLLSLTCFTHLERLINHQWLPLLLNLENNLCTSLTGLNNIYVLHLKVLPTVFSLNKSWGCHCIHLFKNGHLCYYTSLWRDNVMLIDNMLCIITVNVCHFR